MVRDVVNALVGVLLAPVCPGCGGALDRPIDTRICDRCWRGIPPIAPPICARCGDALGGTAALEAECARCREAAPAFDEACSAGRHDGPLRAIIHAFKYGRHRLLAEPLAALIRDRCGHLLDDADGVIPVPLHPLRSIRRGFNQADDLARGLGRPVWRVLRRRRRGPPQASLPVGRRHDLVAAAYAVSPVWPIEARLRARRLEGATVVLVDDVMTTGATADACSRVLRDAGVSRVRVVTAARAVVRQPLAPSAPPSRETLRR